MDEVFIPIYEAMGRYEISNLGRVKSWFFKGKRRNDPKFLKPGLSMGYPSVVLVVDGVRKTHFIHRLLATYFIPNRKKCKGVNHIDGNRANFDLKNLEWATQRQNMRHAVDVLDKMHGCKSSLAIFTDVQLSEIYRLRRAERKSATEISKIFNCSSTTIVNICAGRRYKKEFKRLKDNANVRRA